MTIHEPNAVLVSRLQKAAFDKYLMETGPLWNSKNVSQHRIVTVVKCTLVWSSSTQQMMFA